MRLLRLRVEELRRFRAPFELAGLQPGLNVFTGPNEAGKSTLVRALRAAFFERHRSTSVDDLRPWGDAAAAPRVELDFEHAGVPYHLAKSFLHKKRCELRIGERRLEGVEAEDALAELLGFQYAAKGASRPELWGIPGLLWIEQGASHELREPVGHAGEHLRRALDASLGEVAASGGDEVLAQVRRWRDELLTPGTGRARGALQKAHEDAAAQAGRVAALEQAVAEYRDRVDRLRSLRDAHAADLRDEPWRALRTQLAAAQQALQAAEALAGERTRTEQRLQQAAGLRTLLAEHGAAAERQRQDLATREAALAAAHRQLEQADAVEAPARQAEAAAAARWQAARATLALARQEHNRTLLLRQAADARTRAAELHTQLQRVTGEAERAAGLQREAARLALPAADLKLLRQRQARLDELRIRRSAAATRLGFALAPGVALQLDGETLAGEVEREVVAPACIELPGLGRITVTPGGADLPALAGEQARLEGEQQALLQRLGLAGLADAEARVQSHALRAAEAEAAAQAVRLLAPQGADALQRELDLARARLAEAEAALAQLPPAPAEAVPALDAAESRHDAARVAAEDAARALQAAREARAAATSRRDAALRERDALQAAIDDPQAQAARAARTRELAEAAAHEALAREELQAVQARIAAARPEILAQDVARLQRSAEEAERAHQARDREIAALESALATAGAQGLEDDLAQARAAAAQGARRAAELQRRADALDHLLQCLQQRREALTQRLRAPLQKHLDRLLSLLFPGGRLQVDERLVPGALVRPGAHGPEVGDLDALSFGAREQTGVIARIAYADLLRDAGRPTLVVLDDALVHSDEPRLAQMKRVLFDAAQRHQVLLFTCHPARWRDLGVPLRTLHGSA